MNKKNIVKTKVIKIKVCIWKSCLNDRFSNYIIDRLKRDNKAFYWDNVIIEEINCMWECKKWPNIKINGKIHNYMDPIKASKIMKIIAQRFRK